MRKGSGKPLADRFWPKVRKGDDNECWTWTGAKSGRPDSRGRSYSQISSGGDKPRLLLVHRVAWELAHGAIPEGMHVCHKCDNPSCVNARHLFLGTQRDNIIDAARKGHMRGPRLRGERVNTAKLTRADVRVIRAEAARGVFQTTLAKRFGVSSHNVSIIVRGLTWREESEPCTS
jgi:hypothetical protein